MPLNKRRFLCRLLCYITGLFLIALGSCVAINSGLGISPVSSLPYVISLVSGLPLSGCVIAVFSVYVLLQILILRREFRVIQLIQLVFSALFGYFVDLAMVIVAGFSIPTYAGRLLMLAISMVLIALGVLLYIGMDLIPMAMEGLSLAVTKRFGIPFQNTKILIDCLVVGSSVAISLICTHRLVGVREGTILSAVFVGKLIGVLRRFLDPVLHRIVSGAVRESDGRTVQEKLDYLPDCAQKERASPYS